MDLLLFSIVGGLTGYLAGLLLQGQNRGLGISGNIPIGIIGGLLGGHSLTWLGITAAGLIGSLITAFVGALILLFMVGLLVKA